MASRFAPAWVKALGPISDVRRVAVDASGNVHLVGVFERSLDLGRGAAVRADDAGLFVAKLDPRGEAIYAHALLPTPTARGGQDEEELTVDAQGNVVVSFTFEGTHTVLGRRIVSRGGQDVGLAKLAPDGTLIWLETFGASGDDRIFALEADAGGNVIFHVAHRGEMSLGGPEPLDLYTPNAVGKLSPEGRFLAQRPIPIWVARRGGLDVDPVTGEVFVAGNVGVSAEIDGVKIEPRDAAMIVMKLDASLRVIGHLGIPGPPTGLGVMRARRSTDGFVVLGFFFGGVPRFEPLLALDAQAEPITTTFLVGFDRDLRPVWQAPLGTTDAHVWVFEDVAVKPDGNLVVLGDAPDPRGRKDPTFRGRQLLELDRAGRAVTSTSWSRDESGGFDPSRVIVGADGVPIVVGSYLLGPHTIGGTVVPRSEGLSGLVMRF